MAVLDVYSRSGDASKQIELSDAFVDAEVNESVVHQCVVAHLANRRRGTAAAKTRAEVSGSGKKLYRQKGTGRARMGDIRSSIRVHGGIIFGPKPRSYRQFTPKKVRRLGLLSALASKFQNGDCVLIEDFTLEQPKTKAVVDMLSKLELSGKTLFVIGQAEPNIYLSARNVPKVDVRVWDQLSVYDVVWHDKIVLTETAAASLQAKLAQGASDTPSVEDAE